MSNNSTSKNRAPNIQYGFALLLCTIIITTVDFLVNILKSSIPQDMDIAAWIYFIPASIGHSFTFALALFLVFYLPIALITRKRKIAAIVYIIFAIILQTIIILDGFVFNLYRFHINGFVLDLLFGAGSDVFVFEFWLVAKFTILIFLVAILPYLIAVWASKYMLPFLKKKTITIILCVLILCLGISHIGHAYASAAHQPSIQRTATILPFFFPLTANSLFEKLGLLEKDEIDKVNYNIPSSNIQHPLKPLNISDSIPNYNILYLVIDSWNPTAFDSITTPNMYKFAQKSELYNNHFSCHHSTRASIFGLFFGLPFSYEKDFHITQRSPLLIDQLIDKNYNIQTFPSATFKAPPFHEIIFKRLSDINIETPGKTAFDRDNKITEMAVNFINEQEENKPFFAFMFYDLLHAISLPKEYRNKFQPSWDEPDYMNLSNDMDRTPFFNLYRNCVYHVDSLAGIVINTLEEKGLLQNTVVVITADHGQEFNENKQNYWGHSSNYSEWQLKVPLIVYAPNIMDGKISNHMTTHYDITPTILNRYFGVTNPFEEYSVGYDVANTSSRYPHIVGGLNNFGFIFEDIIVSNNQLGALQITDRNLKELPRDALKASELQKAIKLKNRFYK